jgi:hypothetical protein
VPPGAGRTAHILPDQDAVVALGPGTKACPRLNGFLELFGGAESNLLAGFDLDLLPRGRVAAHARRALADLEDAEATASSRNVRSSFSMRR